MTKSGWILQNFVRIEALQKVFDPIVLRFPILIIYVVQSIYKPPATVGSKRQKGQSID